MKKRKNTSPRVWKQRNHPDKLLIDPPGLIFFSTKFHSSARDAVRRGKKRRFPIRGNNFVLRSLSMKSNRLHSTRSASWLTTRAEVIAQSASTDRWGRQAAIFFPFESKPSARSLPPPLLRTARSRVSSLTATASLVLSNQFHTRSKVNLRNERRKVNIETSRFEIYRDGAQRTVLVGTEGWGRGEGRDNISKSAYAGCSRRFLAHRITR